ncbi:MAG: hypothetical protein QOF85_2829, partial [Solirubrobacterales bacterium]|nr:hypothetical protein [Solirubrobacterales bacterium]
MRLDGALATIDDETMVTLSTTLAAAGKGVGNVRVAELAMTEEEVMGALRAVLAAVEEGAGYVLSAPLATADVGVMGALSIALKYYNQRGSDGRSERRGGRDRHSSVSSSKRRVIVGSTDGTDLPTVKTPGPKCFRISGVPQDWSEVELIDALRATDWFVNDNSYQLSIYPACYGFTQTAL